MKKFMLTGLVLFYLAYAANALAWEILGQKKVDFGKDDDRIEVGKKEGKYNAIQVRVKDAPVEIQSMVIKFGNGEKFEPNLKERMRANSESRAINLPGNRKRTIKSISFRYASIKTNDKKQDKTDRNDRSGRSDRSDRSDRSYSKADDGKKTQKATVQVWGR